MRVALGAVNTRQAVFYHQLLLTTGRGDFLREVCTHVFDLGQVMNKAFIAFEGKEINSQFLHGLKGVATVGALAVSCAHSPSLHARAARVAAAA